MVLPEAVLTGAAGAAAAWCAGALAGLLTGLSPAHGIGLGIVIAAAVVGGLNGLISGAARIYDWRRPAGWTAFLLDSTWGLIGTAIGELLHLVNRFYPGCEYRHDLSRRQNRHVYNRGFGIGKFTFTQGHVITSFRSRGERLLRHETLHIWQNRIFGPIYPVTYYGWELIGIPVALVLGLFVRQPLKQSIQDVAYLDNPWETWAYQVGGTPEGGALCWIHTKAATM